MTSKPIIQARNVSKWFNRGRANEVCAVDRVSLEVMENQWVVLYGPSGSGKTTLLGILGTLDRPTEGEILLDGRNLTRYSDAALSQIRRLDIGFVFQSFNLISGLSARENVAYPLVPTGMSKAARFERADAVLEKLGLGDRIHHSPEELSGGEQQRVAIARALINDPRILIADEPTSNIDEESAATLLTIFDELLNEGKTLLVSSHDPIFRDRGDVVFSLKRGKLSDSQERGREASAAQ